MDRHSHQPFKKAGFLLGALFLCWAAQAQTTNQAQTTDSTHHQYGMHHGWASREGFGPGPQGSRNGFQNNRRGFQSYAHHPAIHYTPEQRKQLIAINKDYRKKSEDLFKQDNLTLKQYKAGLIALQKEKKDKMTALLTQQQKDQLAAHNKRRDENRQVMEAAHLERLKLRLNLTDDQVAKLKAGQENLHDQVRAIHENDNLLPQEKHEQTRALLAKRNDTYKSVLTPEQYSQFEKMHPHGGPQGYFRRPGGFGRPGATHDGAAADGAI